MFDKRVTVLAMIPSGTRSKNVEAYIESAANQGYITLVLKIKTIDEWMDPNLLLICDRVHEDVPFYDDTHGLITAFRESVKASKAGASTADIFAYHRIALPFPVEQQFCDFEVPCSHHVVIYPTGDGTDVFFVVAHMRAIRDNYNRQPLKEKRIASPPPPFASSATSSHRQQRYESMEEDSSSDSGTNEREEIQGIRRMMAQMRVEHQRQQELFTAFMQQQQQQHHASSQHQQHSQQGQQQATPVAAVPRTPPAASAAAAAISPPVAQFQQVATGTLQKKRAGRTITTPTSKGPPKAPKGS
jgi:hypothetical protein